MAAVMSDIQKYLLLIESDESGARDIVANTVQELKSKRTTLIDVVQSLEQFINDENATIRSNTIQYLSMLIGELSPTFLSRQQIQVLCQFFCDRIEDEGSVGGLYQLQSLGRFNKDMAAMTFRAMIEYFQDLQIRPQAQRFQIFILLNALMSRYRTALKEMGNESIVNVTDLVRGEKDPRNLMIIFSILKVIMMEWDISAHAEPLFDSVFCYFPITFRPPPNDPYGITAKDLKSRLRDCISASGLFAPFAFPQLIEKLDSTSVNVKKDVLQTIASCVASYGVIPVSNFCITLWDSLKYEILNAQEEDLAEEALLTLQAIAAKLSYGLIVSDQTTALARYLRPITKECIAQIQEPQQKQARPVGQILGSLSKASTIALSLIVKTVLPSLLTLYQAAEDIPKKRALLEVLLQLLCAKNATNDMAAESKNPAEVENPFEPFRDSILELAGRALMSTSTEEISFRVIATKTLLQLCLMRHYLRETEFCMIIQHLNEVILLEVSVGNDNLKIEAVQVLVEISRVRPDLVMDISFPAFIARLPDSISTDKHDYLVVLEGLAQLSVETTLAETLIRRLLNKLELVLQNNGSSEYSQAILSTLYYVLSRQKPNQQINTDFCFEKIVIGMIRKVALASIGQAPMTALNEDSTMEMLGRLAKLIVQAADQEKQLRVGKNIYTLFTNETAFHPIPYRLETPLEPRMTMILSTWLMAAISKTDFLPFPEDGSFTVQVLLKGLVALALTEDVPTIRQTILRQISLITNKFLLANQIHFAIDVLWNLSTELTGMKSLSENSVRIIFWIAKGLVLRLEETEKVLEQLIGLLSSAQFGSASGRGFGILLAPDEVLSKENGATIRLLANQKVFNYCIPRIARDFQQIETLTKPNYLTALAGILKHIDIEVIMTEIGILLPLLLQSLDIESADLKAATIESLIAIGQESATILEEHSSSLVSRLLSSTKNEKTNDSKVRHAALRCLRTFPNRIKDSVLLPLRSEVIKSLMSALDDPKRHIRKEAVECRAAWFRMDEPDDE